MQDELDRYSKSSPMCYFIEDGNLIECYMDEIFEDAQDTSVCPPVAISEDNILPLSQYKYQRTV